MKRVWERKRPPPPADESWELMEAYVKEGRGKTIGVCNYTSAMLDDLMSRLSLVPPHERAEREE
ncbi:MAG: hypothetical protein JXA95_12550 [Spirochaetales bacterium]|nr:hypothetical protein [Spirochaetales bacterium]